MEPLINIPQSDWSLIRDIYKENWPKYIVPYMLTDTQIKYPDFTKLLQLELYCPYGIMSNGIIGISCKEAGQELMIHPLNDISIIEDCLRTTKLIKWDKPILAVAICEDVLGMLKRMSDELNVQIQFDEKVFIYFLDKRTKTFDDLSCPSSTYVGPLVPEHLDLIDRTWTYTSKWSRGLFEALMKNGLTYVLYSSDGPLAWITNGSEGALTHMYCLPDHRHKGYAEFITKYAVNNLLKSDNNVLTYTLEHNIASQKLFTKLGFQNLGYVYWVIVKPK